MGDFCQYVTPSQRRHHTLYVDPGPWLQPRVPLRHASQYHLTSGPQIQFGLRQRLRMAVVLHRQVDERALGRAADLLGRYFRCDRASDSRLAGPACVLFCTEGVPAVGRYHTARRVAVDLDPGFQQRVAQEQAERLAEALERDQMQCLTAQTEIQAAGFGCLSQEIEIGLSMLNQATPSKVRVWSFDREPQTACQLARQLCQADLHVGAHRLALAEAV